MEPEFASEDFLFLLLWVVVVVDISQFPEVCNRGDFRSQSNRAS